MLLAARTPQLSSSRKNRFSSTSYDPSAPSTNTCRSRTPDRASTPAAASFPSPGTTARAVSVACSPTSPPPVPPAVPHAVLSPSPAVLTGTVAVIGNQLQPVRYALRSAGWAATGSGQQWEREDRTVAVLEPDAARGLEFDTVIVTEPADFAQDLEHRGSLYTALTRGNRELVVVHSRPLPDALRRK
jgi:hypothetical protein